MDAVEKERLRAERDARDIELINRFADQWNADAQDGLEDQADIFDHAIHPRVKKKSRKQQR